MAKDQRGNTAKSSKSAKPDKPSRRERWKQIRAAFTITRQRDARLVPWLVIGFAVTFAVVFALLAVFGGWIPIDAVLGVLAGLTVDMMIFGRRAQKAAFSEAEGQPGAAVWVVQGLRGDWRATPAAAANTQLDVVHRVLGRPGVLLIGEGAPHRVKGLIAQEKKRVARVAGDAPIYDIVVGEDENEISLRKLSNYCLKLPRNLTPAQLNALEKRMTALGGTRTGMPKGPIPKGARVSGMERTIRRR
ncbi:MAG TPA: DUF4191 domain-containing protein [Mycobacteriales bacterium]|nr:DUF4191 domain-containing protein [Mycobacteriales bacterium]